MKTAQIVKVQEQREEQRYTKLRNRKGEYILHFFNQAITYVDRYDRFFDKDMQVRLCQLKCKEFTKNETGYTDIQSALNDGWHFVTKLDVAKYDDYKCSCRGEKVILRK